MIPRQRLSFSEVDDLAFAAERGRLDGGKPKAQFEPIEIGPLIELAQLSAGGLMPAPEQNAWIALDAVARFYSALTGNHNTWICPQDRKLGLIRISGMPPADDTPWTAFCLAAQQAAVAVGFPKHTAAQLIGALGELRSNIYEHAEAAETGLVAFRATVTTFEFVVADTGIGVLASLRCCADYADLENHGNALRLALTEGCSRFGSESGRGMGFRPLFVGLANLNGALRFRSGDHALTIDGQNPSLMSATIAQKPHLSGFLVSVTCLL